MISVGNMDTPIYIEKPEFSTNANYGGIQAVTWAALNPEMVWAYRVWKGGKEKEDGDQMIGNTIVEFYIRYETYNENILPSYRIKHTIGGSTDFYYIDKIDQIDGRNKITKITATKKEAE
tara:strand:- start:17416 stop:17775 length:360 start_codon:yes stop_codon:yes gene_type:complete